MGRKRYLFNFCAGLVLLGGGFLMVAPFAKHQRTSGGMTEGQREVVEGFGSNPLLILRPLLGYIFGATGLWLMLPRRRHSPRRGAASRQAASSE